MKLVVCLCCGSAYASDDDCPNVDDGKHSGERALAVARHLSAIGVQHPTTQDVLDALAALDS